MTSFKKINTEFKTLDESIVYSKLYNRWFKISSGIVVGGVLLGGVAKVIYGRELQVSDPWIGSLLGPLSYVWIMAFFHMFYVMVKVRFSTFTRWLCRFVFVVFALILGKILVIDSFSSKEKPGEQNVDPNSWPKRSAKTYETKQNTDDINSWDDDSIIVLSSKVTATPWDERCIDFSCYIFVGVRGV